MRVRVCQYFISFVAAAAFVACATVDTVGTSEAQVGEATQGVRIVEVLAKPAAGDFAFIELRNDGPRAGTLARATLTVGATKKPLKAIGLNGAAPNATLEQHALALVVDDSTPPAQVAALACEAPIAVARRDLGPEHAANDDTLVGSIELGRTMQRCAPVFGWSGLNAALASSRRLVLSSSTTKLDEASSAFGDPPVGVSLERSGLSANAFVPSAIGASPGSRNFTSSDPANLSGGPAPIRVAASSPWRAGVPHEGDVDGEHRLTEQLVARIASAKRSVHAAFYQLNEPSIVLELVRAKQRGLDVAVTTDAEFATDRAYVDGFKKLEDANISLYFDRNESGENRAALSHNKILVVDGEWVWTGSFNPIEDEPARIHADNAVEFHSPELARLHESELRTMFDGKYGVDKRDVGVSGGAAFVDGAEVIARFSPGLTEAQAKARALALASSGGDPRAACGATNRSGKPVLQSRYTNVAPCGGPTDLLNQEVARATSSVYFVQFGFTLDDLADTILARAKVGGVEVKGVVDATVRTSPLPVRLGEVGDVRFTPNSDPEWPDYIKPRTKCPKNPNKVWLHHKFLVIDYGTDHPVVITGSHNMSTSAEQQNDDSLVVVRDRAVAESYYRMFREIFDHPQTLGPRRPKGTAPAIAMTKVYANPDPAKASVIEVTNFERRALSLKQVRLWNRKERIALKSDAKIPAEGRAWLVAGDPSTIDVPPGVMVVKIKEGVVTPSSALVLETGDHEWLATFDPFTSATSLPQGASAWKPGVALALKGLDAAVIEATRLELIGDFTAPATAGGAPTWTTRGSFSDWADGYDVTRAGLALWLSHRSAPSAVDFSAD
jgi:phosphatidylserine/phosphatidylglycerophosphate/cardiolipin synthase-like enzyme